MLFLSKAKALWADSKQRGSNTHSAGDGRDGCKGQPRVQSQSSFLQKVHKRGPETPWLKEVCSVMLWGVFPASIWANIPVHHRYRQILRVDASLQPFAEAMGRKRWSPCLQQLCAGELLCHQAEELCQRWSRKNLLLLGLEVETPRMVKLPSSTCRSSRTGSVSWQPTKCWAQLKHSLSTKVMGWSYPFLEHWWYQSWTAVSTSGLPWTRTYLGKSSGGLQRY